MSTIEDFRTQRPRSWQTALRLMTFHGASWWNWRNSNVGRLVEPVVYFVFLCTSLQHVVTIDGGGVGYLRFAYVGMLGYVSLRIGLSSLVDVANDRKWGVYALARLGGGSGATYLASIAVANALIMAVQVVLLTAVLAVVGESAIGPRLLFVAGLAIVGSVFWTAAGALLAFGVASYATRDLLSTLSLLPIALTAPVFYPTSAMPAIVRAISKINPLTYELEILRGVLDGRLAAPTVIGFGVAVSLLTTVLLRVARRAPLVSGEMG